MNQIRHGWAAATVLSAIVLIGLSSQSIQAQTAEPAKPADAQASQEPADVQQLKDRVKQLEQTVDELKRMIGTVEKTPLLTFARSSARRGSTSSGCACGTRPENTDRATLSASCAAVSVIVSRPAPGPEEVLAIDFDWHRLPT